MNSTSTKIGLYIHIPFCSSKCNYCDFYSETKDFHRVGNVIKEIIEQLKYHMDIMESPEIETIFIGGGTPSLIPLKDLRLLFKYISEIAHNVIEWSIESNPESITKEFLLLCHEYGVNRLSVGIQSFNNILLKTLGRNADSEDITRGLNLVKQHWTGSLNLDLISSIPGQNKEMVREDIKKALSYRPDHISFYSLSVEEGTGLEDEISKGIITELSEVESEEVWFSGRDLLLEAGYNNYEISNYTRNKPCLHNVNYWELKPYLGLGPGAVSTIIDSKGDITRITNSKSISEFLAGMKSKWGESKEKITPKEFLTDYIVMGLRLKQGIDKKRFFSIFGYEIDQLIKITNELESENVIDNSKTHYKLTESGFDIMNSVCVKILDSLENIDISKVSWFY